MFCSFFNNQKIFNMKWDVGGVSQFFPFFIILSCLASLSKLIDVENYEQRLILLGLLLDECFLFKGTNACHKLKMKFKSTPTLSPMTKSTVHNSKKEGDLFGKFSSIFFFFYLRAFLRWSYFISALWVLFLARVYIRGYTAYFSIINY